MNLRNTSLLVPSSLEKGTQEDWRVLPSWGRWLHFCKYMHYNSPEEVSRAVCRIQSKQHKQTCCFWADTLSLPCDPHWQGGLCHALGCNGTNAARDTAYCTFLPAQWTLAVQLCKTCPMDVTYTTASFSSLTLYLSYRQLTYCCLTWFQQKVLV